MNGKELPEGSRAVTLGTGGAEKPVSSRDVRVLVDQAAEPVPSQGTDGRRGGEAMAAGGC